MNRVRMRSIERVLAWLVAMVLMTSAAVAGELAGVRMPDQVTVKGQVLVLNGLGLREATIFKIDIYVAGLYLTEKSSEAETIIEASSIKQLELRMIRNVSGARIAKAIHRGFKRNAADEFETLRERLESLNSYMSDLQHGDSVTLTQIPAKGIVLEIRGDEKTTIPGDDFARVLWRIWLGPSPPNPELRLGLLGQN